MLGRRVKQAEILVLFALKNDSAYLPNTLWNKVHRLATEVCDGIQRRPRQRLVMPGFGQN